VNESTRSFRATIRDVREWSHTASTAGFRVRNSLAENSFSRRRRVRKENKRVVLCGLCGFARQVVFSHLLLGERESPAADGEDTGAWSTGGVSQDGVADDSFSLAGEARGDVDPGGSAGGGPFAAGGRGDQ